MVISLIGLLMVGQMECLPQLPAGPAHPNPAHTFIADPTLAAHPNPAHTSLVNPSLSAHPNAAHTQVSRPDCTRFSGAFPCAPGDNLCEVEYKESGCGK